MSDPGRHTLGTILCAGTVAAFAAVTPPALAMALATMNGGVFFFVYLVGVPIAILHSWVLGLPAYFVLRERWALSWEMAALGGFVVGILPAGAFALASADVRMGTGAFAAGMLGAVGGLGFKAFLRSCE